MAKLLSVIILILAVSTALAATDCTAGAALRTKFGLESVNTPTVFNDTKYCKSLKNQAICCTDDAINSFQKKSDDLTASLTSIVAARDIYLIKVRNIIPDLRSSILAFETQAELFFDHFGAPNITDTGDDEDNSTNTTQQSTNSSSSSNDTASFDDSIETISESIFVMSFVAGIVVDSFEELKANFSNYQKARSSCIVEVVKLQNAAWCLACDPNLTSKGYTASPLDITLSTDVCNRLQDSCYDFIANSGDQNMLLTASYLRKVFVVFTGLIKGLLTGDTSDLENFANTEATEPSGTAETPASVPDDCTAGDCSWICTNMFSHGQIDEEVLAAGGDLSSDTTDGRLLLQDMVEKRRGGVALQENRNLAGTSGSFNPDSDEAGTSVAFQDDPGNVNKESSTAVLRYSIIAIVMINLAVFLA